MSEDKRVRPVEEIGKEIARWIYELDKNDEVSGGLARTVADKISQAITQVRAEKDSEVLKMSEKISELQDALLKIRVVGGLEAEMARCFDLVIKRDEEISKHKAALRRMRENLINYGNHRSSCNWQSDSGGCNCGYKESFLDPLSESAWREWREKSESIKGIEEVVYVPGHHKCPKCNFYLVKSILHPNGISADRSMPEQCPNDGTEMMAVTWKENAQDGRAEQYRLMQIISDNDARIKFLEKENVSMVKTLTDCGCKKRIELIKSLEAVVEAAKELMEAKFPIGPNYEEQFYTEAKKKLAQEIKALNNL